MEIKSEFDINDFDLIKKYILPKKAYIHILAFLILVSSIFSNNLLVGLVIGISGILVMEILLIVSTIRINKIMKERFKQALNGKEKLEVDIKFDDETFTSHSSNTDSKFTLSYNEVKKLVISDKYSILFTAENTFLIIETDKVIENKLDEFLFEKNPKIKIR